MAGSRNAGLKRREKINLAVLCLLFGAGTVFLAGHFVSAQNVAAAYRAAPSCSPGVTTSCAVTVDAVVVRKGHTSGRNAVFWLTVTGIGPGTVTENQAVEGGVWPLVEPGDTVAARVWEGQARELTYQGVTSATTAYPDAPASNWMAGLFLCGGAFLSLACFLLLSYFPRFRLPGRVLGRWFVLSGLLCASTTFVLKQVEYPWLLAALAVASVISLARRIRARYGS